MASAKEQYVMSGGAGRGSVLMMPTYQDWNQRSDRFQLRVHYVDPIPGRAEAVARAASSDGVPASFEEGRIEDVMVQEQEHEAMVVLHLDQSKAIAKVLQAEQERPDATLGYLLMRTPKGELAGIELALQPSDRTAKATCARFFDHLARFTARSGSDAVIGEQGLVEHRMAEPVFRAHFARHFRANMPKLAAGIEPESYPLEITWDGRRGQPFLVLFPKEWSDPIDVANHVVESPEIPLIRGGEFTIAECGPDGIRLHQVRRRVFDDRISVQGAVLVNDEEYDIAAKERARREARAALERAQRQTISRTQPVWTSD